MDLVDGLSAAGIVIVAVIVGLVIHRVVWTVADRVTRRTRSGWDEYLLKDLARPAQLLFVVVAVFISTVFMGAADARDLVVQIALFVGIMGLGWLVVGFTHVAYDVVMSRYTEDAEDVLEARQMRTQLGLLQRFGAIIIWLVALALALLTIPGVAPLAASLLAGAGVLGIVLGVAAGPLIGNLIAGIQIAFTQPIKVGDVVVIEGEWGHVGEITAAYVVIHIWDKRRLIVPLSDIVNKPVENWTRVSGDLLGTVKLYLDYRAPVEAIRTELKRILDESGQWDGVAWSVLVTGADDRTITVRALFSAPDASVEWSLRCLVRERLVTFLQEQHPEALPVAREIHADPDAATSGTAEEAGR